MDHRLGLDVLRSFLASGAALRRTARLQPAGGQGDKVFPPTYEGGVYAAEERVVDGRRVPCVLLDSVQSQANRMESALLRAQRAGKIPLPVATVDFAEAGLPEVGRVTSLDAPHRLADAILRDSLHDGKPFRSSPIGQVLDTATTANATGLFEVCPTALLFGIWDSAGPRRGLGTKFARALVAEMVAVDATAGVRPSSRIDPLGIQIGAGTVYQTEEGWTLDDKLAKRDEKGKPLVVGKKGKPSELNHGNVTPSLGGDKGPNHGGVTFAYARHAAVLSLPALRRLEFPDATGRSTPARDEAARAALAALGLAAMALVAADGYDLRSRCLLVPEAGAGGGFELVKGDGATAPFALDPDAACALLSAAVDAARNEQLSWQSEGFRLTPKPELVELVRRSRAVAMDAAPEAGEG